MYPISHLDPNPKQPYVSVNALLANQYAFAPCARDLGGLGELRKYSRIPRTPFFWPEAPLTQIVQTHGEL